MGWFGVVFGDAVRNGRGWIPQYFKILKEDCDFTNPLAVS